MIKKIVAEFIGTFFIIFLGCGTIILNNIRNIGAIAVGLSFGITLMAMIYLFGKISGSHFNPAVSFTFFVMGQIKILELLLYIISQFFAGILACFFLVLIFGKNFIYTKLSVENMISSATDLSPIGIVVIIETILSFIIMFLYTKATNNGKIKSKIDAFFIGSIFFVSVIFLTNINNIGLNTIRIVVPSLYNFKFEYIFYYLGANWTGTFLGGISYYFINKLKK